MSDQTDSAAPELAGALNTYAEGMRITLEGPQAETGQSPREVVWTKNKAQLYHYVPVVEKRFPVPVLLVYALINRPYILDLMPGQSFVEYLVSQGFDVYLLDWGIPGDEDSHLSFEHYVLDYIPRAVRTVLRESAVEEFTLFGYCMGGTMCAMYAALFPDKPLRNLVLLTTPIDFAPEHTGLFGLWTSEKHLNPDRLVDAFGNVPAEFIDTGTRMLKPVDNYVGAQVTMWDRINQGKPMDAWLAMNKWVNDGIPFPGEAFRHWIRDFYQQNRLVKGEIRLRGRQVDLASITCPVLNVAGKRDHICLLAQTEATMKLIGSQDKERLVLDAGHVGLLAGSEAKKALWPKVRGWLAPRSK
ncbi:MAG: class III poly(R)-hydroxyalkanoic acid synthase subunit PhaC [Ktedonobacterales bacterium]